MDSERLPLGVFTTDSRLHVRAWDAWMAKATGAPAGQALGRPLGEVIPTITPAGLATIHSVLGGGTVEVMAQELGHDAVTQFIARRDDGSIVGVSTLVTVPIPTAVRGWVEDVIVDEASNNQGIGRLLLEAMVARASELGCKTVDLTSRPSREAANHLYRTAGFEPRETNVWRLAVGSAPAR